MAARDIDSLLEKLTKINAEMGGDESKKKKGKGTSDRFEELKTKIGERLHRLKSVGHSNATLLHPVLIF